MHALRAYVCCCVLFDGQFTAGFVDRGLKCPGILAMSIIYRFNIYILIFQVTLELRDLSLNITLQLYTLLLLLLLLLLLFSFFLHK